ncbi:MAG TPA: DegT/DnrJ/EryC1/StrS aminotransferase family protein, partial [Thermofilum sp.]|nr:DegT/DnrJ/EryC1/StrS aminotransferase family protein [Thermofilum sp.]
MNLPAIEGGTPVREKPLEAWPVFTDEEKELVLKVLNEGRISSTAGTITRTFEAEFSRFIGSKYAVAVFNGTASLHTALAAIGVGPGDEVITTPFSFVASATSILHQNAIPI